MPSFAHNSSSGLVADWKALERVFIRPDKSSEKALLKYMQQILFGLQDFLKSNLGVTEEIDLRALSERYTDSSIAPNPENKLPEIISEIIREIAPRAVNVSSPYFVGHMTSAIPFFMVHLKTIVAALNQNVIKLETSKVVSIVERQVIARIHRLLYDFPTDFYDTHIQAPEATLGAFTEGGTTANLTALWTARNALLGPQEGFAGVEAAGVAGAYKALGITRSVILVSRRGHYSLKKAGGVLGIGNENVVSVDVDQHNRIDLDRLKSAVRQYHGGSSRVIAVVGIAGTTETGNIDPLAQMADICSENGIHFHVDAAWGGPTMVSDKYRHLLAGIQRADSITIDAHKQFYMPMSCGVVLFKDPQAMDVVAYHANYVNRPGSVDLGIKSFAGSREAHSLTLYGALKIMGTRGYALLIDHGIETARRFAARIDKHPDFEVTTRPELNILTYRMVPGAWRVKAQSERSRALDDLNTRIQRIQREKGKSFVSRTRLPAPFMPGHEAVVFRCVIMNPLTNLAILEEILQEQAEIGYGLIAAMG